MEVCGHCPQDDNVGNCGVRGIYSISGVGERGGRGARGTAPPPTLGHDCTLKIL